MYNKSNGYCNEIFQRWSGKRESDSTIAPGFGKESDSTTAQSRVWQHNRESDSTIAPGFGTEPETKQFCFFEVWAQNFRWWNRSLKFSFRFHKHSLWSNGVVQIMVLGLQPPRTTSTRTTATEDNCHPGPVMWTSHICRVTSRVTSPSSRVRVESWLGRVESE